MESLNASTIGALERACHKSRDKITKAMELQTIHSICKKEAERWTWVYAVKGYKELQKASLPGIMDKVQMKAAVKTTALSPIP